MSTPTITEISSDAGACVRAGSGWAHVGAGGCSSGGYWQSSTLGDTLTVTFSGRAIYANLMTHWGNDGGAATITLDGVVQGSLVGCHANTTNIPYWTVLTPVARNLTDGAHTLVLTTQVSTLALRYDSFMVLSGAKGAPVAGNWSALGDSWTTGGGSAYSRFFWLQRAVSDLASALGRPIILANYANSGECYHGFSGSTSAPSGGLYRLSHQAALSQPEFLTMMYGVNDLSTSRDAVPPSDYHHHISNALSWIEDAYDTAQTKVFIATPGAIWSYYHQSPSSADRYELGVRAVHNAVAARPWCNLVPVYEAMAGHPSLITTSGGADFGLHPNEDGHAVIATEHARVMALAALSGAPVAPVHAQLVG